MKNATEALFHLVDFAVEKGLVEPIDRAYALNRLLEIMQLDAPEEGEIAPCAVPETATAYLEFLCDDACARGLTVYDAGHFPTELPGVMSLYERFLADATRAGWPVKAHLYFQPPYAGALLAL